MRRSICYRRGRQLQPVPRMRRLSADWRRRTTRLRNRATSLRPVSESRWRLWRAEASSSDGPLNFSAQSESRFASRTLHGVAWSGFTERRHLVNHATILWPNWLPRVLWFRHACPCCNSVQFKPGEMHAFDWLFGLFALRPVRCMFCWRRYYWFSIGSIEQPS